MRLWASILLAFCFVSVSALAGYEKAEATPIADTPAAAEEQPLPNAGATRTNLRAVDDRATDANDECLCKRSADSLTLTCGVTLALSDENASGRHPAAGRTRFAFESDDRNTLMMYLLRRPPRHLL